MTDLNVHLRAGTILILETGEYSDRNWHGPFRVKTPFVKADVAEAFRAQWTPKDEWSETPEPGDFAPWLVKEGYVEAIDDTHAWHVGSYSSFDP